MRNPKAYKQGKYAVWKSELNSTWPTMALMDKGQYMQTQIVPTTRRSGHKHHSTTVFHWAKNKADEKKIEFRTNLRWEDDGGAIVNIPAPTNPLPKEKSNE